MESNTTRRGLLCIGTAAATMAVPLMIAPAAVAATPDAVSPALFDLISQFDAVHAKINRFYDNVFNPAVERSNTMRASIPHVTIPPSPNWRDDQLFWSTDNRVGVAMAKSLVKHEPRTSRRSDVVCARKLIAAIHRRDREGKRIDKITGLDAANKREVGIYDPFTKAEAAIYAFPVASMADLKAKLAFIERDDGMDGDDLLPLVIRDVARLSGGEA